MPEPRASTTLYRGAHVTVGSFRCPVSHPNFRDEGTTDGYDIVFPRVAVWIQPAGRRRFVADSSLVTLYNPGQGYTRAPLSPEGDRSDWFSLDRAAAHGIVKEFDPAAADEPRDLLRFPAAPSDPRLYLRQRLLFETLRQGGPADDLLVEEEVVGLFAGALRNAYRSSPEAPRAGRADRAEHRAVRHTQAILCVGFRKAMSLRKLAEEAGLSMFRLAHVFREQTGRSLHSWRVNLRLNAALDALSDSRRVDLTELALDLGFSSHSHFTASFRQAFGVPPSVLRGKLWRSDHRFRRI